MIWYKITRHFYFVFGLGFWTNWGHFSISWKLNFSTFDKFAVHFPQVRWENSFSAIQSPIYCPFFGFIWSSFTASFKRKFSLSKTPFTVIFSNGLGQFGSVNRAKKNVSNFATIFVLIFNSIPSISNDVEGLKVWIPFWILLVHFQCLSYEAAKCRSTTIAQLITAII